MSEIDDFIKEWDAHRTMFSVNLKFLFVRPKDVVIIETLQYGQSNPQMAHALEAMIKTEDDTLWCTESITDHLLHINGWHYLDMRN